MTIKVVKSAKNTMRFTLLVVALSLVSGCSFSPQVRLLELPALYHTGAGIVESCGYGINPVRSENFRPSKEHLFASLMKKHNSDIDSSQITIKRFDVYHNERLQLLGTGVVTDRTPEPDSSKTKLILYRLAGDSMPELDESAVGCNGTNEGEYYASRVIEGSEVIVSWIHFSYEGKDHHFRSTYQFRPKSDHVNIVNHAVAEALDASMKQIARVML